LKQHNYNLCGFSEVPSVYPVVLINYLSIKQSINKSSLRQAYKLSRVWLGI